MGDDAGGHVLEQLSPLRLGAIMQLPVIHLYTHDPISMGEDGPTHQPVEQLASLRAMPELIDLRPADANELTEAWRLIMSLTRNPAALVISKQDLPILDRTRYAKRRDWAGNAMSDHPAPSSPCRPSGPPHPHGSCKPSSGSASTHEEAGGSAHGHPSGEPTSLIVRLNR
jgi:hypothetical protein